jgi:hypothetical protein
MTNRKGCGRKRSWHNLRHYPAIYLEGPRKTTEDHFQDILSTDRDLKPGPPDYEAEVLTN